MKLELWAGVECTVARVRDAYRDETILTGHETRIEDLDRLAAMGVRALRYPVLWERVTKHGWAWTDERLARIRELGMRPIVGLVHHGSGPETTNLLEPSFVTGLADFAREVARRYPGVTDYTPVNEPLTTARFSALYGHWYPHAKSDATFARALLHECLATSAAMKAIREITPDARLIQTEDVATVFSTPKLAYQAEFENARRWSSLDLLTGRLRRDHPLFEWLVQHGRLREEELLSFPVCPPDVIGLNYYVTSDRFLDDRLDRYPPQTHGGNGIDRYADVEAVRVPDAEIVGHHGILRATWDRYRIPVAITEVHLGCTREEQIRWLVEAWQGAERAQRDGADVRAITVWAAFGSVDWSSLLTEEREHYEPGAFDVRAKTPRATAIVSTATDLARDGKSDHAALATPGWWRRDTRLVFDRDAQKPTQLAGAPVLVMGAAGVLGRCVVRSLEERGLAHRGFDRKDFDIADEGKVRDVVEATKPWAIVNAAGYTRVRAAEVEPDKCRRDNAIGAAVLARACADMGARFVTFSSHYVFDGKSREPYVESSAAKPLGVYGRSKADAERWVHAIAPEALVIRSSSFFGADECVVGRSLRALSRGERVVLHHDRTVSATYLPDLVRAVLDLLVDGESGVWHLVNEGQVSPFEVVKRAASIFGTPDRTLVASSVTDSHVFPAYSVLASERTALLPHVDEAIARFARERI